MRRKTLLDTKQNIWEKKKKNIPTTLHEWVCYSIKRHWRKISSQSLTTLSCMAYNQQYMAILLRSIYLLVCNKI